MKYEIESAEHLETDDDIKEFLRTVAEEGDASDFIHALNTVARAKGMMKIALSMGKSYQGKEHEPEKPSIAEKGRKRTKRPLDRV
ncbi:MAG: DNA-binding protein [Desulfopila sp.]